MLYKKLKTKPMHLLPVSPGYPAALGNPSASEFYWMLNDKHAPLYLTEVCLCYCFYFSLFSFWFLIGYKIIDFHMQFLDIFYFVSGMPPHSFPCPASLLPLFPPALLASALFRCLPHILHLEHLSLVTDIPFLAFIHIFSHPDMHT